MGLAGCYLPGDGEPQSQTFEVHVEPTNPTTVDELAVVVDDPSAQRQLFLRIGDNVNFPS
jgi:hypothetical protein